MQKKSSADVSAPVLAGKGKGGSHAGPRSLHNGGTICQAHVGEGYKQGTNTHTIIRNHFGRKETTREKKNKEGTLLSHRRLSAKQGKRERMNTWGSRR